MKPSGRLERDRRKKTWPRTVSGLAISLIAGIAWAIPGLNDACEQVRHSTALIVARPVFARPVPAPSNVEPPRLEAPASDPPRRAPRAPELPRQEPPSNVEPPAPELSTLEPSPSEPSMVASARPRTSIRVANAAPRGRGAQVHVSPANDHASAVALDELAASGVLEKNTVRRHIRLGEAKMKYCYERSMAKHVHTGTVRVQFVIKPDGTVTSLTATASGVDGEVTSCVEAIIKAIEFPRSRTSVQVVYPFHFIVSDD